MAEHFEIKDQHPNRALDLGMADELLLSEEAVSDILQAKMVRIAPLKSLGDMRLMYLSWIFDIHFPEQNVNLEICFFSSARANHFLALKRKGIEIRNANRRIWI